MMLQWISEEQGLPRIGQTVLLASPRQFSEFWDIKTAWLGVRHEGVFPLPVKKGSKWPADYSWRTNRSDSITLVTGNSYWAHLNEINLPNGAVHKIGHHGDYYVGQTEDFEWIGKAN